MAEPGWLIIIASMRRVSLAIALLAFASFARAESLRVVAPANGATLRGGSFAELRGRETELDVPAPSSQKEIDDSRKRLGLAEVCAPRDEAAP